MPETPVESWATALTSTVAFPARRAFMEKVKLNACVTPFATEAPVNCGLVVATNVLEAGAGAALSVTWVTDPVAGVTVTVTAADAPTASA
jgi:hypothetical protein